MILQIIFILCVVALAFCLTNYMIDFVFYMKNRYCRFHIGRYENLQQWHNAIEKKAVKWLKKTPTVKITDNSRYMFIDFLTGKYRSKTIQSWQKAALIIGVFDSENAGYRQQAKKAAQDLLDAKGRWRQKPAAVDCGMLSFAVLKTADDPAKIKPAMEESLEIIKRNINIEGMISYTGGKENPEMYVDTLGLVCPFLMLYGEKYQAPELEEIVFRQLELFHKYGLYDSTAIPNHAFHIKSKLPLGVYGWGRGTAWYVIGLMDSYFLFKNLIYKNQVKKWLIEAADCYFAYQKKDGGFGSILQRMQTYDSSVTCVMAWFYTKMGRVCPNAAYEEASRRCLNKLMSCTRITGAIDLCQGDTKDIGIFSQTYDIMPFAQGMALRALNNDE